MKRDSQKDIGPSEKQELSDDIGEISNEYDIPSHVQTLWDEFDPSRDHEQKIKTVTLLQ